MGATSVTGTGHGSVEGKDMGRKEHTIGANRLIGPRVVVCDTVTLSGSSMPIILPPLPTSDWGYSVVATDNTAAAAVGAVLTTPTINGDATTSLVLSGTSGHVVSYMIVKQGLMP